MAVGLSSEIGVSSYFRVSVERQFKVILKHTAIWSGEISLKSVMYTMHWLICIVSEPLLRQFHFEVAIAFEKLHFNP